MVRERHFAGAGKAAGAQRRHRRGRRPSHGAGAGRCAERRHEQFLRPSAQPRRHAKHQALAAAVTDDLAAAGIVIDAEGQPLRRRGPRRHLDLQRHRPPARSARHHDHLRPGDLGRTARPQPRAAAQSAGGRRPAARCIAPTRSRSSPARSACAAAAGATSSREYNKAIDDGTLQKLSPPRAATAEQAWPIKTAPFYAMPICAAITNTMGGIVVDGDARVLDKNDKPIPGLYAAGSTVGGLDGGPHAGYVGGLIKATIGLARGGDDRGQEPDALLLRRDFRRLHQREVGRDVVLEELAELRRPSSASARRRGSQAAPAPPAPPAPWQPRRAASRRWRAASSPADRRRCRTDRSHRPCSPASIIVGTSGKRRDALGRADRERRRACRRGSAPMAVVERRHAEVDAPAMISVSHSPPLNGMCCAVEAGAHRKPLGAEVRGRPDARPSNSSARRAWPSPAAIRSPSVL